MSKFMLEDIWYLNKSAICQCGMPTMIDLNYQLYRDDIAPQLVRRCMLCKPDDPPQDVIDTVHDHIYKHKL